jgi:hypothetical protein
MPILQKQDAVKFTHGKHKNCIQNSGWRNRGHFTDINIHGKTVLSWFLRKYFAEISTGVISLRLGINDKLLLTW